MSTHRFRVTAAMALLAVLLASAVMPLGQGWQAHAATNGLTTAGFWLDDGVASDAGEVGIGQSPGTIRFSFSGYANPQRPFPGYVGEWQLGPVRISGSGELRGSDGAVVSGGQISHTDNLRDRRYPNHSTTWQVVKMLDLKSAGGRAELWLQVQVVSSNIPTICPVGTYGVVQLVDDNRRLNNGYAADAIVTRMPSPASYAQAGGAACGTHVHGFNNVDYSYTDPPRGGANGGIWAIVDISGGSACKPFEGVFNTTYGPITLQRNDSRVTGSYHNRGPGVGLSGVVSGNTLEGVWFNPNHSDPKYQRGRFRSVLNADGKSWNGEWWDANGRYGGVANGTCASR